MLASALVATMASVLLLTNFAQIWFARLPTTEVMAQAFALSGVNSPCAVIAGPTSLVAC